MRRSPEPAAARAQPRIALVSDRKDWHARELTRAFAALGATVAPVMLESCAIDTTSETGLLIPGFARQLPDAVLVRSMAGGSFEAVTLRLGVLHALEQLGVTVWNDARAIERCVDKSATSFLLARAGIRTPPTWAAESRQAAEAICARETPAGPLVLKPLFGSQGRGLRLVRSAADLPEPGAVAGVYYLQRYVAVEREGFRDFRVFVCAGNMIAAMARHAPTWITNVKRGGQPVAAVADAEMKALALAAADAVGASVAGVDLLYGADGRPTVLEVNSMPAWSGLQKVTSTNIAAALAGELIAAVASRATRRALQ
jgi:tetrahydromethanopterin:alpha-L-glutamate ligase